MVREIGAVHQVAKLKHSTHWETGTRHRHSRPAFTGISSLVPVRRPRSQVVFLHERVMPPPREWSEKQIDLLAGGRMRARWRSWHVTGWRRSPKCCGGLLFVFGGASPGSAGVPPASLYLQTACHPPLAKRTKPAFTGISSLVPGFVRAGRPRSQVVFVRARRPRSRGVFLHEPYCLHRENGPRNRCSARSRQ